MSLCSKYPRHTISKERATAGARSPAVRMGSQEGDSCSTVTILDWLAIFNRIGERFRDNDEDCDGEEASWRTGDGGGEGFGSVGATGTVGAAGTVGGMITVGGTATVTGTARLLLQVGSKEDTDGCVRDSLKGWEG